MKRIITIIALQCIVLVASDTDNTKWFAGKEASKHIRKTVQDGLTQAQAMQTAMPATAGLAGTEFGKNLVNGATDQVKQKAYDGQQLVYAAAAAALASPAAPYVIAAGVGVLALGATAKCTSDYRESGFRRCLNTNFAGDLNERGFPQRCESPERKFAWWQPEESVNIIEHYRGQRKVVQKITKGAIYK